MVQTFKTLSWITAILAISGILVGSIITNAKIIGFSVLGLFFIWMPIFLTWRYGLRDWQKTFENTSSKEELENKKTITDN